MHIGLLASDTFTHRPWPRAPRFWGTRATLSYDDSILNKDMRTAQRDNFTIYLEMSRNANVYSRLLSVQ